MIARARKSWCGAEVLMVRIGLLPELVKHILNLTVPSLNLASHS
jgi:hypothetical protein